ncbi:pectate lyase family protein [Neolewinella litorea]|uniref:T9SS type A sorting domain-containing protein n=1 Tax=Neolewinella litorea TaxID=2562452 RepID=A0A4S4NZS6_9BACT|nr:T9SS type A sorting domain-containing protein [Neolewinella litorea]THH41820.1 T9SS type A sorting domain-containing protein [Neolewinella litorea]
MYQSLMLCVVFLWLPIALPGQEGPIGWASLNGGTTGGEGGETVTVSTRAGLVAQLQGSAPRVILVQDTIELNRYERVKVYGNKSLRGVTPDAMIRYGGLEVVGNNVIIQNLSIGDSYDGDWLGKTHSTDGITVYGQNVWIDHCWMYAAADGLLDIRSGNGMDADYITVSNCRFSDHNKVSLIGSSDEQVESRGHLRTTYYNCWFDGTSGKGLSQRMPRTRFGDVHVLNTYFEDIASYCIAANFESRLVVENNYFRNSRNPHSVGDQGRGIREPELVSIGNIYDGSTGRREAGGDAFVPANYYSYTPLFAAEVPAYVMNAAGPFNPANNHPPVAVTDSVDFSDYALPTVVDVTANDFDVDGGELRISRILNDPPGLAIVRDNRINFIPPATGSGMDTIEYELVDTQGGVAIGRVLIAYDGFTTATRDVLPAGSVNIFPNPATSRMSVSLAAAVPLNARVRLFDGAGRLVHQEMVTNTTGQPYEVNVANLPRGAYHLLVTTRRGSHAQRLLIVR